MFLDLDSWERDRIRALEDRKREANKLACQVETTVERALLDAEDLETCLRLQNLIDEVKKQFPDLYDSKKITAVVNKRLRVIWGGMEKKGVCPHVRAGYYSRARGKGRDPHAEKTVWHKATIVNYRKVRGAKVIDYVTESQRMRAAAERAA
jgi:hypothetical protein